MGSGLFREAAINSGKFVSSSDWIELRTRAGVNFGSYAIVGEPRDGKPEKVPLLYQDVDQSCLFGTERWIRPPKESRGGVREPVDIGVAQRVFVGKKGLGHHHGHTRICKGFWELKALFLGKEVIRSKEIEKPSKNVSKADESSPISGNHATPSNLEFLRDE